jgi:hypothetical protein
MQKDELKDFIQWLLRAGYYNCGKVLIPIQDAGDLIRRYRNGEEPTTIWL